MIHPALDASLTACGYRLRFAAPAAIEGLDSSVSILHSGKPQIPHATVGSQSYASPLKSLLGRLA